MKILHSLFIKLMWHIPSFLIGTAVAGYLYLNYFKPPVTPEMLWAKDHTQDVQWAMDRRAIAEKALNELLRGDAGSAAITVIKKEGVTTVAK